MSATQPKPAKQVTSHVFVGIERVGDELRYIVRPMTDADQRNVVCGSKLHADTSDRAA